MRFTSRLTGLLLALGLSFVSLAVPASAAPPLVFHQGEFVAFTTLCTGEQLELQGTATVVVRRNTDGTLSWIAHVYAVGSSPSQDYVFNMTRRSIFDASGGFELSGTAHSVLVSKGDLPNELVWFHFDFTASPPVYELDVSCPG